MSEAKPRRQGRIWAIILLAIGLGILALYVARRRASETVSIPYFTIPMGKVRDPLPYRIISFHRGRVDKNLIQLASQLGFNGVQIQIEGSNESGIKDFAARDARERIIDFCHSLGMEVSVWVHEVADLPPVYSPKYLGPVTVDNAPVWDILSRRYDWILSQALPKIDALVLTTVETQYNATTTPVMLKLTKLIDQKCRQYGKKLIVRTFVWHPSELEGVMGAVSQLPDDIVIMSKIVPQDWQMRGGYAMEIGNVGQHPQIIEYDLAGEYFLSSNVANCMVDLLKTQFDYGLAKNAQGICVRVDRYDASVIWEPNEVNLWTMGMLAAGATDDTEEIWDRWATYRYGAKAAPAVIAALKPTPQVITEMLSIGPFTYGDTRGPYLKDRPSYYVALPYDDILSQNWQMWRWDSSYERALYEAMTGDPLFIDTQRRQKAAALTVATQSLRDLEQAQPLLPEKEYQILHTRLLTNKVQLEFRSQAILAALHYRQMLAAKSDSQLNNAYDMYKDDLSKVKTLAESLQQYPPASTFRYLGKTWPVNAPLLISPEQLHEWLTYADLVTGQ